MIFQIFAKKKNFFSLQILVIIDDFLKFWQKNDNFLLLVFLKLIFKIDQKMMPKLHFFLQILAHCEFFVNKIFHSSYFSNIFWGAFLGGRI